MGGKGSGRKSTGTTVKWVRLPDPILEIIARQAAAKGQHLGTFLRRVLEDLALGRDPRELFDKKSR